ncbi:MAG: M20/M25/M40 family metallo-hydrolase [Pseudomonadota bacterium]
MNSAFLQDPITPIERPSITPIDAGAQGLLEDWLGEPGFAVDRETFGDGPNLDAMRGEGGQRLYFSGHTDEVPPSDEAAGMSPPFQPIKTDGLMRGRGASDRKGAIAAFVAVMAWANRGTPLALLITNDDEDPGIDSTKRMLVWLEEKGITFIYCEVLHRYGQNGS